MTRLTAKEIEAINRRAENATEGPWGVNTRDYPYDKASKLVTNNHVYIAKAFVGEADAEFIANAREDIPKLLEEVERLRGVLSHIDELSDEFFEIEVINGKLMFVICEGLEGWSDLLSEISIASYKAVNA